MYARLANAAGDDLDGISALAISAEIAQPSSLHQPAMPLEEHLFRERFERGSIEINHHFGYPAFFGGPDALRISLEAELPLDGGLHAGPVKDLAFNGRGGGGFGAHGLDQQQAAFLASNVTDGPQENATAGAETCFRRSKPLTFPGEFGPIGQLPVPEHERRRGFYRSIYH